MSFRPQRLQKQCRERLAAVDIPDPWDVNGFCDRLAERRGRPLRLLPVPPTAGTEEMCGAWASLPEADFIFVKWHTSSWHREQIILHECSHMICEHSPSIRGAAEWVRQLLPTDHWDAEVVAGVLMRSRYDSPIEQEAETLASLIEERAPRQLVTAGGVDLTESAETPEVVEILQRFARALGVSVR
jgi:hypothetical protein